jgi:hypothetical protein
MGLASGCTFSMVVELVDFGGRIKSCKCVEKMRQIV